MDSRSTYIARATVLEDSLPFSSTPEQLKEVATAYEAAQCTEKAAMYFKKAAELFLVNECVTEAACAYGSCLAALLKRNSDEIPSCILKLSNSMEAIHVQQIRDAVAIDVTKILWSHERIRQITNLGNAPCTNTPYVRCLVTMGTLLSLKGCYEEAEILLMRVLTIQPLLTPILTASVVLNLVLCGNTDKAVDRLHGSLRTYPTEASTMEPPLTTLYTALESTALSYSQCQAINMKAFDGLNSLMNVAGGEMLLHRLDLKASLPLSTTVYSNPRKVSVSKLSALGDFNEDLQILSELPTFVTRRDGQTENAFIIENVLSEEECKQWIHDTEHSQEGYEEALVNIGYGQQKKMLDVRKSSRCIIDSPERANDLWKRICKYVPAEVTFRGSKWRAVELNERLRFLRYDVGEYFRPHNDGCYRRPKSEPKGGDTSFVTFQLYLNDDCFGGTTRFFGDDVLDEFDVVPKAGSVLLFQHPLMHSGETVTFGRKYAMRTDVMYTRMK